MTISTPTKLKPFIKYAGGKRKLLPVIIEYFPLALSTYYEPFLGGGAVLFHIKPRGAVVSDINEGLINAYNVIRDYPDALIAELRSHVNTKEHFLEVRAWDRTNQFSSISPIKRAARLIYLNKTCYNGLHRVNKKGQFNVPFGNYKRPMIVDQDLIYAIHKFLTSKAVQIYCQDFEKTVAKALHGDFVYFDPPYDGGFTQYSGTFDSSDQERLKAVCDRLNRRGCNFLLSNSNTRFISDLYRDYEQIKIEAPRAISCDGNREKASELLIRNYPS